MRSDDHANMILTSNTTSPDLLRVSNSAHEDHGGDDEEEEEEDILLFRIKMRCCNGHQILALVTDTLRESVFDGVTKNGNQ